MTCVHDRVHGQLVCWPVQRSLFQRPIQATTRLPVTLGWAIALQSLPRKIIRQDQLDTL